MRVCSVKSTSHLSFLLESFRMLLALTMLLQHLDGFHVEQLQQKLMVIVDKFLIKFLCRAMKVDEKCQDIKVYCFVGPIPMKLPNIIWIVMKPSHFNLFPF